LSPFAVSVFGVRKPELRTASREIATHVHATLITENGVSLATVSMLLGHASIKVTEKHSAALGAQVVERT
jgi:site-specific recombinase XerD